MSSVLVQDALDNVWAVPDPFKQVILKPNRLTPINGVVSSMDYAWETLGMPNAASIFHIYQIGQVSPNLIDLFLAKDSWQLCSAATTATYVTIDIYTASGVEYPRTRTWYRQTKDKNILFAVEQNSNLVCDFNNDPIYIRLFKNAYFDTNHVGVNDKVKVSGGLMASYADINALAAEIAAIITAGGAGGLVQFINGYKRPLINITTVAIGDVAEYVYDSTIYKVADFQISTLPSFSSTLDSKVKSLLHYAGNLSGFVDYVDLIDIYMVDSVTQKGVYVHKNAADTLRMVTYKDYSFVTGYLSQYYPHFLGIYSTVDLSRLYLRLHIRHSGNEDLPAFEHHQTKYLMKLSDAQFVDTLVGPGSGIALWKAAALENSGYTKIMRSSYNEITQDLVERAYGYGKINSLTAMTPQATANSAAIGIPAGFQKTATAFEYDVNGQLLGYYAVPANALIYTPYSASATNVEFVSGVGGVSLDETYEIVPTLINTDNHYRYYIYALNQLTSLQEWRDVTDSTHYSITSGVANWDDGSLIQVYKRMVRSDKQFLLYQANLTVNDGLLIHSLTYTQNTTGGQLTAALAVPLGELDLWLNGHALVEGIDYVYAFPTVSIISKAYLVSAPGTQVLTVRYTGFCDELLLPLAQKEIGYVYNGLLSANGGYDLHEGRVQRVIVGGAMVPAGSVSFVEQASTGSLTDGTPYSVRDVVNPLIGIYSKDPYRAYARSKVTDKTVTDYLTVKVPQVLGSPINPITNKYQLYSPFICKILYDLRNGYISDPLMSQAYPDSFVTGICASYFYLLKNDPISVARLPDLRYCVIHPHWLTTSLTLNVDRYRFLTNVVRIYANGIVNLTPLVTIDPAQV